MYTANIYIYTYVRDYSLFYRIGCPGGVLSSHKQLVTRLSYGHVLKAGVTPPRD